MNPHKQVVHRNYAHRGYGTRPRLLGDDYVPGGKHFGHIQCINKFIQFFRWQVVDESSRSDHPLIAVSTFVARCTLSTIEVTKITTALTYTFVEVRPIFAYVNSCLSSLNGYTLASGNCKLRSAGTCSWKWLWAAYLVVKVWRVCAYGRQLSSADAYVIETQDS